MPVGRPHLYGPTDLKERHRLEFIIATARAFLAGIALLALWIDPSSPSRDGELAYRLLLFYDVHSALVLVLMKFGPVGAARFGAVFHAIDLVWAVAVTFLTEGPGSPYFALFVFVLLAAAYRWGFRETLLTGVIAALLFLLEAFAVWRGTIDAVLDLNSLIMRSGYFLLATFLLGYLSDQAKGLRAEAAAVNRLTDRINVREGLAANLRTALTELMQRFGSREALLVLQERSSERVVLWEAALDARTPEVHVRMSELNAAQRVHYFFHMPDKVAAWEVSRRGKSVEGSRWIAIDKDGKSLRNFRLTPPAALRGGNWNTVLGVPVGFSGDWEGRLFLIDPTARPGRERRLRFLQSVMAHASPVLHNVYLLRRLRLRAGALERSRVARELHDSVIQSLIGVEMQLDVARRDPTANPRLAAQLEHTQNLLRQEILNVRDLMEQLRPRPADTRHLLDRLADLADRFRRETGIEVELKTDVEPFDLEPELCHELTRIVQEALINVRKHSGASKVEVTLGVDDWAWRLEITDNGHGFGFSGKLSHAELTAHRVGPRTIRERAEVVGAKLQVRSTSHGTSLEIIGRLKKPWITTPSASR